MYVIYICKYKPSTCNSLKCFAFKIHWFNIYTS